MQQRAVVSLCLSALTVVVAACKNETPEEANKPAPQAVEESKRSNVTAALAKPSLLLTQAQFEWKTGQDGKRKPQPGPAKLMWLSPNGELWKTTLLEDPDSRVFHKAVCLQDGQVLTIGGTDAHLKTRKHDGQKWTSTSHWNPKFGGKWDRLRDFEIGDVDHDGEDELVVATHDQGVIAVVDMDGGKMSAREVFRKPDTFIHEIEIGDVDGDGKLEFFATPSAPNKADASQGGGVLMFRFQEDGEFESKEIVSYPARHAKEILVTDIDGDGTHELYVSLEAKVELGLGAKRRQLEPLEIQRYVPADKGWKRETVAILQNGVQARVLLAGNLTGNGKKDLVVTTFKDGIWRITPVAAATWSQEQIDRDSSGFEHAATLVDLDGNGQPELYVAADDQDQIRRYTYEENAWKKESIWNLEKSDLTWSIEACL